MAKHFAGNGKLGSHGRSNLDAVVSLRREPAAVVALRQGGSIVISIIAIQSARTVPWRDDARAARPGLPGDPHSLHTFPQSQIPCATSCGRGNPI